MRRLSDSRAARLLTTVAAAGLIAGVGLVASPAAAFGAVTPQQAFKTLNQEVSLPGTAWLVNHAAERVVVSYDRTVSSAELARLTAVTDAFGHVVRLEPTPGRLQPHISGGDAITSGGAHCALGFNARAGSGAEYFLTAGHCASVGSTWQDSFGNCLGVTAGSSFPGNDYGVVRYTCDIPRPGNVNLHNGGYRDITSAGNAHVGQPVCMSGPVAGLRCGTVVGVNATVNYPQGPVYGLIHTDICSAPGESGAPLFSGGVALGTLVGGSGSGGGGDCDSGGTAYFQPVTETLDRYGLSVY